MKPGEISIFDPNPTRWAVKGGRFVERLPDGRFVLLEPNREPGLTGTETICAIGTRETIAEFVLFLALIVGGRK